jgi:photosystem II stability/assembly factor-like uncharacterized protein
MSKTLKRKRSVLACTTAFLLILSLSLMIPTQTAAGDDADGPYGWYPQDTGAIMTSAIDALDANTAWAVGSDGDISKTCDGGETWVSQESGTDVFLTAISAVDAEVAWAVGQNGTIIKTSDGGVSWHAQFAGEARTFTQVSAVDANVAWALQEPGVVFKTFTGGSFWYPVYSGGPASLFGLCAVDAGTAWAVGENGYIVKTTDGGFTWRTQYSGVTGGLSEVDAVDADNAWAVEDYGSGVIRTVDGGDTWIPTTEPGYGLFDIDAVDADTAWAVGGSNLVHMTTDGGETWEDQLLPASIFNTYQVCAVDSGTAWALGSRYFKSFGITIFRTADGGANWAAKTPPMMDDWFAVHAVDGDKAWVAGFLNGLIKTADGGSSWLLPAGTWQPVFATIGMAAYDANTAWMVGMSYAMPYYHYILRTTDGGLTLTDQGLAPGLRIDAADDSTVWAVGSGGSIQYTSDAGATWTTQTSGTSADLNGVSAADADHAWAVGEGGAIVYTSDAGATWTTQTSGTSADLNGVSAADADHAWAVGARGTILHTENRGEGPPPPQVTSIEPDHAYQHTIALNLTINGNGFMPGATVRLEKGDQVIQAYDVNVTMGSQLTCKIGLFGVETGSYDAVVTNPDGQAGRLAGGFSVDSPCGQGSGAGLLVLGLALGLLSLAGSGSLRRRLG